MRKEKKITVLAGALLFISITVLYLAHRNYPFEADDLWYGTNLATGGPLSSLRDIWESQVWHYFNWGGRSIGHAILQLTLWAGESAADVLNVLATLLLAFVLCRTAGAQGIFPLFLTLSMMLGLTSAWRSGMLWQSGAANYVYLPVIVFSFLFCYLKDLRCGKRLPLAAVWMPFLGLAAGWSNENIGPAVWILTLILLVMRAREKGQVPLWMITGNLACLVGSIIVVAAPGNFTRGMSAAENGYGLLWRIFLRCYAEMQTLLVFLFPALLTAGFVCLLGKAVLQIPVGRERALFLLGALLSWGALILSPAQTDRACIGTTFFLIVFTVSYLKDILRQKQELLWPTAAMGGLIWLKGMYVLGEFICICWGWIKL